MTFDEWWEKSVKPFDGFGDDKFADAINTAAKKISGGTFKAAIEIGREAGLREAAAWVAIEEKLPEADVPVLAYFINEYGKPRRIRAFYAPRFTVTTGVDNDWYEFKDGDDEAYLPEGWYESNEFEDTHWHVTDKVTHWMPLPEPPSASPPNIGEGEQVCAWVEKTHKYRVWRETACGNENYSMDEEFKFCPYCGKRLKVKA